MKYVRVQKFKFVYGIDALNDAIFEGWAYVEMGSNYSSGKQFLVRKQVKKRVYA